MQEHWLTVPGFDDYEVSDQGQVRSIGRYVDTRWNTPRWQPGRVLQQSNQGRYLVVTLYRDKKPQLFLIHRLVLLAFVGPCPDGCEGLHFDDDPHNNRLANLRWGSPTDNALDCIRNGNHPKVNITHCPKGHEYTDENTYMIQKTGHRQCRACIKERGEERKTRPHPRDRTHCPKGHPYDEANTAIHGGRRQCRTCGRDRNREFARRKAEARRSAARG